MSAWRRWCARWSIISPPSAAFRLVAVFDRPKTMALKWGRDGVVTEWNPTFAGVALDLGLGVEVCWPYRPQEKGSVENLVGWVKGSFFKQRRFLDREDLERQLREWLTEANTVRPSRATGVPPVARIGEERARLRPLKVAPADLALRIPVSVGPTGVVIHDGHPYSMPPDAIGLPGTLYLYRDRVRIVAGRFGAEHVRQMAARRRVDPAGASRAARRGRVRQARAPLSAAPASDRSRRRGAGVSHRADASASAHLDPGRRAAARAVADARRCGAAARRSRAASPSRRSARSTSRTISATPTPALPFDDSGPAADDSGPSAAARRPGPGRRRRPQGRSAAEHLDAAEHGGILSPRRRPVMIAARSRSRRPLQTPASRQCPPRLAGPRPTRGARELVLSATSSRCWSTEEIAHRQQTRLTRLTRRAHFPFLKTIDDFNFTYQSTCGCSCSARRSSPDFVTDGRSLIFAGKPGRGKTHLAVADGVPRDPERLRCLLHHGGHAHRRSLGGLSRRRARRALPTYTHPAVLVVDEVGYLTYGTDAANMLFHVVNERHRRKRSMIFTTNKSLKAWGRVLHDEDSRRPSSIASSSAAGSFDSTARRSGRCTSTLTTR